MTSQRPWPESDPRAARRRPPVPSASPRGLFSAHGPHPEWRGGQTRKDRTKTENVSCPSLPSAQYPGQSSLALWAQKERGFATFLGRDPLRDKVTGRDRVTEAPIPSRLRVCLVSGDVARQFGGGATFDTGQIELTDGIARHGERPQ